MKIPQLIFHLSLVLLLLLALTSCEKEQIDEFYITSNVFYMPSHYAKFEVNSEGYIFKKTETDRFGKFISWEEYVYDTDLGVVTTVIVKNSSGNELERKNVLSCNEDKTHCFSIEPKTSGAKTYNFYFDVDGKLIRRFINTQDKALAINNVRQAKYQYSANGLISIQRDTVVSNPPDIFHPVLLRYEHSKDMLTNVKEYSLTKEGTEELQAETQLNYNNGLITEIKRNQYWINRIEKDSIVYDNHNRVVGYYSLDTDSRVYKLEASYEYEGVFEIRPLILSNRGLEYFFLGIPPFDNPLNYFIVPWFNYN